MNSTELHIKAGGAIAEWGMSHREGCILTLDGESVICCEIPKDRKTYKAALSISAYEVANGMKSARWDYIGTTLHNLYCKEIACRKLQKP